MNRVVGWQWDDIRFFLAVSRAGSLSGAARVLGVGHVTVGRRVVLLEKRLGVKLLNRTPEGFSIALAGQAILGQCAAMENTALDLERIAAGRDSLAAGTVRLTTTEALAHQVVAPAIAAIRKRHKLPRADHRQDAASAKRESYRQFRRTAERQAKPRTTPNLWYPYPLR